MTTVLVSKGQEQNNGFPHLQAYRLIRAYAAAEAGDLSIANRFVVLQLFGMYVHVQLLISLVLGTVKPSRRLLCGDLFTSRRQCWSN